MAHVFRPSMLRARSRGFRGFGAVSCGSGLIPTGDPLAPCVYPGVTQTSDGTPVAQVGGGTSAQCMQYSDFLAAIGGLATCDPRDVACAACNTQKSAALSNLVGGGCVPLGSNISFSCDTSQGALNQFQSNTPVVNNATVNGSPDAGWVAGTPQPIYAAPTPVSTPVPIPTPVIPTTPVTLAPAASSSPGAALQTAQASVSPSSGDWLTQSMLGGIPNWGLLAGGAAGLFLLMSMGGRH